MDLESDSYDVIVLGTGLAESIAAAALAKTGKTVLHLDPNEYYGGQQASLTLDELQVWAEARSATAPLAPAASSSSSYVSEQQKAYTHASTSPLSASLEKDKRRYALSLFPAVLPSRGALISTLIASDVSKYVSFRLLESVGLWQQPYSEGSGSVKRVPGSKEQVFKDSSIGLVDKRRLMKFLMYAAGEFDSSNEIKGKESQPFSTFLETTFALPPPLASQISFAIAHCSSPSDPTLPALLRTRRYLKSIGRYGAGAFLIGQYGGAGEVAQGFCRACAVFGGTYVLGPSSIPDSWEIVAGEQSGSIRLKLPCHPRPVTAGHIIASPDHLPPEWLSWSREAAGNTSTTTTTSAHCIAIVDHLPAVLKRPPRVSEDGDEDEEGDEPGEDDTAVVIFPPEEGRGVVRALMMGEGTGSCPAGQFILYLSTEVDEGTDPQTILAPYLRRLSDGPAFEAYYLSHYLSEGLSHPGHSELLPSISDKVVVLNPYHGRELLTEGLDWEAEQGEAAFWAVVGRKDVTAEQDGDREEETGKGFFDKVTQEGEEDEEGI